MKRKKLMILLPLLISVAPMIAISSACSQQNKQNKTPNQNTASENQKTKKEASKPQKPKNELPNSNNKSKNSENEKNKNNESDNEDIKNKVIEDKEIENLEKEIEQVKEKDKFKLEKIYNEIYNKILHFISATDKKIKDIDYVFALSKIVNFYLLITSRNKKEFDTFLDKVFESKTMLKPRKIVIFLKKIVKNDKSVLLINKLFLKFFDITFKKIKRIDIKFDENDKNFLKKNFFVLWEKLDKFNLINLSFRDYIKALSELLDLEKNKKHKAQLDKISKREIFISLLKDKSGKNNFQFK
ncbi:hypothetical protein [Mycoplasmopsis cricetuli]|uniref:hypothetical protein n=1 Tax=Mycoplasmopsis cricetuli TaxID=171283 RepID=UPI0004711A3C|nr:hypothetical protein [Mycoplasmopsis cricetuli]